MNEYLSAQSLSIVRQQRSLFRRLDLTLYAGSGIHLIGANGSGKTTLLQLLAGILPCTRGTVRRTVPLIFLGHKPGVKALLTVRENIALFARLYHGMGKLPRTHVQARIEQAIDAVALEPFAEHRVVTLSAGQQRRVQLARLWLDPPPLWLLDEPLNSLDQMIIPGFGARCTQHLDNAGALLITSHQALPFADARMRRLSLGSDSNQAANGPIPL